MNMKNDTPGSLRPSHKEINSMFTSIQAMAKTDNDRYDAGFSYFCISRLNEKLGQSKRFIMCKLLETGLAANTQYSPYLSDLRKEYEKVRLNCADSK